MTPSRKSPALVILALVVFLPVLALSKMRGLRDGGSTASDVEGAGGFSPVLIIVILLVVVAFAFAGSYLMKK